MVLPAFSVNAFAKMASPNVSSERHPKHHVLKGKMDQRQGDLKYSLGANESVVNDIRNVSGRSSAASTFSCLLFLQIRQAGK